MNNLHQDPDWGKALKEAKSNLLYYTKQIRKIEGALPYLEEMAQDQSGAVPLVEVPVLSLDDFSVSKAEVDGYLKGNFMHRSDGRIKLFALKCFSDDLYYKTFVNAINLHGDDIKADSFFYNLESCLCTFRTYQQGARSIR